MKYPCSWAGRFELFCLEELGLMVPWFVYSETCNNTPLQWETTFAVTWSYISIYCTSNERPPLQPLAVVLWGGLSWQVSLYVFAFQCHYDCSLGMVDMEPQRHVLCAFNIDVLRWYFRFFQHCRFNIFQHFHPVPLFILENACIQEDVTSIDLPDIQYNASQLRGVDGNVTHILLWMWGAPMGVGEAGREVYRMWCQMSREMQGLA